MLVSAPAVWVSTLKGCGRLGPLNPIEDSTMAYERIMGLDVIDDQGYDRYRAAMMPILKSFGGSFGFDFKVSDVLLSKTEDNINRVFTILFPSKIQMDDFFSNPDYLVVKATYFNMAVKSMTIISMHEKEN
jgi:uncharacterized protein (DUF1330 family)